MTLTEFLTARLDEAAARAGEMGHADYPYDDEFYWCPAARKGPVGDLEWGEDKCDCHLAERKARVLREVEAKRKILDQCVHSLSYKPPVPAGKRGEWALASLVAEALAAIWRDHPDFDPDWLP